MTEASFWPNLEFRVSREFGGLKEGRYRNFWCDGFCPSQHIIEEEKPRIAGMAWICNGPQQSEWDFVLFLPRGMRSLVGLDWGTLLPPENATRWMGFDEDRRYIEIDPAAAVPDGT